MRRKKPTSRTSDGLRILNRITGRDAELHAKIAHAKTDLHVAQLIYGARTAAGFTQQQLANLAGTRQSVIARLEDADYRGHSLTMLNRIAAALNRRIEVKLVPIDRRKAA